MATLSKGQRLLGRFVLIEPLGRGGQAEVWRALDETRSVQIAIKVTSKVDFPMLEYQYLLAHAGAGKGVLEHFEPHRHAAALESLYRDAVDLASGGSPS